MCCLMRMSVFEAASGCKIYTIPHVLAAIYGTTGLTKYRAGLSSQPVQRANDWI